MAEKKNTLNLIALAKQYFSKYFEYKKLPLMIFSAVLGGLIVLAFLFLAGGITGLTVSDAKAGELMVDFLNEKVGGGVELVGVEDTESLYEITVLYQGMEIPVYMTKDGKYFVQGAEEIAMTGDAVIDTGEQTAVDVPKSSKPIVELFVMTYCPYGLQAEKGIISALKLLSNKIDGNIRFVHYFMHGDSEEQETYRQLCIREEQNSKFLSYLGCFTEKGDAEACIAQAGIDKIKVNSCVSSGKGEDYYASDSELSERYGVRGSPTLIINGVESGAGRSSASYLDGICNAFSAEPSECSQTLSSESPSAGFGSGTAAAADSAASCG